MKQYCRICFIYDVKMHKFDDSAKRNFIASIFKQQGYNQNVNKNHYLCYICEALLSNSYNFIERALRAQQVFHELLNQNNLITAINILQDIDRCKLNLDYTNLSINVINIGSIDEYESLSTSIKEDIDADADQNNPNNRIADDDNHGCSDVYSDPDDNIDSVRAVKDRCTMNDLNENPELKETEIKLEDPNAVGTDAINDPLDVDMTNEFTNPKLLSTFPHVVQSSNENDALGIQTDLLIPQSVSLCSDNENKEFESSISSISSSISINKIDLKRKKTFKSRSKRKKINTVVLESSRAQNINKRTTQKVIIVTDSDYMPSEEDSEVEKRKRKSMKQTETKLITRKDKTKLLGSDNRKKIINETFTIKDSDSETSNKDKKLKKRNGKPINHEKHKLIPTKRKSYAEMLGLDPRNIIINKRRKRTLVETMIESSSEESDIEDKIIKRKSKIVEAPDEDYVVPNCNSSDSDCETKYPMTCAQCDSLISSKMEHYHHYMEYHPKIKYPRAKTGSLYVCDICGAAMNRKHHFHDHLLKHEERTIQCDQCPKMCHTKTQLKTHTDRVHGPRNFVCDYCHKRFPDKSAVKLHIRTHTGQKPFKCHICGAGFAHGGNRLLHIRVKHQNRPYPLQEKQEKENEEALNQEALNQESLNQENKTRTKLKQRKRNKNYGDVDTSTFGKRKKKQNIKTKKRKTTSRKRCS